MPAVVKLLLVATFCAFSAWGSPLVLKDDYRSPRNKERPLRKSTRLIVLHTTEAHAKSSLNKLSERGEAHYCLTEEGEAYRIIDKDREAFHAGRSMWNAKEDCDEYSIGIEVVGFHNKTMPLKQLLALKELVRQLKQAYKIPDHQVVCHSHVAYGAPNTWHKKKHRGRKRCGMLFAMPSVRAKLGLTARPAYDPDVRAKRLVQADGYLNSVLYGSVDTMTAFYGKGRPQISAAPTKAKAAAKKVVKGKSATKRPAPKPVMKPKAVKSKPAPPKPPPPKDVKKPEKPEEESDWLRTMGLKGGYFKKKAKLIMPAAAKAEEPKQKPLPLPKDLHVRKMGDDVKDLAALAKLPGYTRGGPVNAELTPYKIAGPAWRSPTTYYYGPRGKITTGDKIDEKAVEAGTFIFYKK